MQNIDLAKMPLEQLLQLETELENELNLLEQIYFLRGNLASVRKAIKQRAESNTDMSAPPTASEESVS